MSLRAYTLCFLMLGVFSTVASADWFENYRSNEDVRKVLTDDVVVKHHSASVAGHVLKAEGSYNTVITSVDRYFTPQVQVSKARVAPSFDIVAREMEQVKLEQIEQEHALITYFQDGSSINIE